MVKSATIEPANALSRQGDWRRIGRTDVDPALLPLPRSPADARGLQDEPEADCADGPCYSQFPDEHDDLGPSRGIFFGVILSLPLWGAICGLAYFVFRYI
jgi:hypothetical protein